MSKSLRISAAWQIGPALWIVLLFNAGGAHAGEAYITELVRGHAIAEAHCSVCHAVGAKDESPTRVNVNTTFLRLAERFPIPMLKEAARTGFISGHDEMPDFQFSPDDVRALLIYIDSFAPEGSRYVQQPAKR